MKTLKQLLLSYFRAGLGENKHDERYRRMYVVNLFSFVGMSITGMMAINGLFSQDWLLAAILFIASGTYLLGFYLQKRTGNIDLASNIVLYSLMILMIYLVYSGGVNNTGPLWIFMVAPVALFLHGFKKGLFDLGVFLIIISIIMFYPDERLLATTYDIDHKTRLILSFLTVTFLSAFYEHSREESYRITLEISQEFERLAKFDPLTKLSNRRDALEKLEYEFHRMKRTQQPFSVLLCDVDHFKSINDQFGHEGGDVMLKALADLFKHEIRAQDTVARWGGEEFLFILPQTDINHAAALCEKLHQAVRDFSLAHKSDVIRCTVSFGMQEISESQSIVEALHHADLALYQAKEAGRDRTMPLVKKPHIGDSVSTPAN
ncbi:GGDEF domain-containing protein [Thalassotalea euphylliae]|uniref:GGDEF domain-containing protein n=1 Tax=Thalassotalea euphylliae TaxID=1655234 RepID=UPI00363D20F6